MNDYFLAFILGIVEGLTEFLPVSSTAHLRISQALLGIDLEDGYWKMFAIVIQLGAILCLPIFFRARIGEFFRTFPHGRNGDRTAANHPLTLTAIAFVCTAGPSFLLTKVIGKNLENLTMMGCAFIVGGIIMWAVDARYGDRKAAMPEELEHMTLGTAVGVGLCQTLAPVFPGTSRSMVTIAAGQIAGLSRTAALEFSFLLSIPTLAAATAYDLLKYLRPSHKDVLATPPAPIDAHGWILLAIGFFVSFVVAYAVVAWFMNWVRSRGFVPFAIYRIAAGVAVLVWAFNGAH